MLLALNPATHSTCAEPMTTQLSPTAPVQSPWPLNCLPQHLCRAHDHSTVSHSTCAKPMTTQLSPTAPVQSPWPFSCLPQHVQSPWPLNCLPQHMCKAHDHSSVSHSTCAKPMTIQLSSTAHMQSPWPLKCLTQHVCTAHDHSTVFHSTCAKPMTTQVSPTALGQTTQLYPTPCVQSPWPINYLMQHLCKAHDQSTVPHSTWLCCSQSKHRS